MRSLTQHQSTIEGDKVGKRICFQFAQETKHKLRRALCLFSLVFFNSRNSLLRSISDWANEADWAKVIEKGARSAMYRWMKDEEKKAQLRAESREEGNQTALSTVTIAKTV